MVELVELPDVALQIIFCHLPLWQIVQLARMCRKLNVIMQWRFGNVRKLRVLGGSIIHKRECPTVSSNFYDIDKDDDITLVLRFRQDFQRNYAEHEYIQFSEDLSVLKVDQIDRMCRWFRSVTHLTVLYGNRWPGNGQSRLIRNFPNLTHLRVTSVGLYRRNFIDWPRVWPAINSLERLEHLQMDAEIFISPDTNGLDRLVATGRLRTLMYREKNITNESERIYWNKPTFIGPLETFGVSQYKTHIEHFTNPQLLRRLRRLHIDDSTIESLDRWNLTDWTALETLHITVFFKDNENHFRRILQRLAELTNLTDLNLVYYEQTAESFRKPHVRFVSVEDCQGLPIFPSVRRFHLCAWLDPHNLHLLGYAFPNASHFEYQLRVMPDVDGEDEVEYFHARPFLAQLCTACKQLMQRAILRYGENIESFRWFHKHDKNGPHELLPKVVLFTKVIGGRTRANYGYTSIE